MNLFLYENEKLDRRSLLQMTDHCLKVLKEFLFKKALGAEQTRSWIKYFDVGAEQERSK